MMSPRVTGLRSRILAIDLTGNCIIICSKRTKVLEQKQFMLDIQMTETPSGGGIKVTESQLIFIMNFNSP